ncbi:MAG: DUF3422 domain-containing protein [Actinobacteria bacterium HGW-Actinobacteria-2]|nr:MAG: DUF3422 domain-containing protein [Actinobacteria bacterium HGW-Actinobacteria-2]
MTLDLSTWTPHPHREALLAEVHARPFRPTSTPARFLRFAFLTNAEQAASARARMALLCHDAGQPAPDPTTKHHRVNLTGADGTPLELTYEQHGEFVTYDFTLAGGAEPFNPPAAQLARILPDIGAPGEHIVSVDLCLAPHGTDYQAPFDKTALAAAKVRKGAAVIASDFRADEAGFVRWLVVNKDLDENAAGATCQRVTEIETYRTLALLGLPEATRLAPRTARIEWELAEIAAAMSSSEGTADDTAFLIRLTQLAADLEADVAASAYRFAATRAYDDIVAQRLRAVGEEGVGNYSTITSFLTRRSGPAMRTCRAVEQRQAELSKKLARSANLLRTRVDVEIEQQNSELLVSMNKRSSMQLRMQQTVEGLSVAAISYYVVSLLGYVFKAMSDAGWPVEPTIAMGISVPFVAFVIWLVVRRIRRRHSEP